MCFEPDALPAVSDAGLGVVAQDVEVRSADGASHMAFVATPEPTVRPRSGVVVLPDVRGRYPFYEHVARSLAASGHAAVTIDYYGRTAGVAPRGLDFPFMDHAPSLAEATIQLDVAAAVERLRETAGDVPMMTLGFCLGAQQSWLAATHDHGLSAAIGFYGSPRKGPDGSRGVLAVMDEISTPILALQAGADQIVPLADTIALKEELGRRGSEHEVVVYEGAPHSFFDRRQSDFADASRDAWKRTLTFVDLHGSS